LSWRLTSIRPRTRGNKSYRALSPCARSTRLLPALAAKELFIVRAGARSSSGPPALRWLCGGIARRVADRMSVIVSPVQGRTVETTRSADAHSEGMDARRAQRRGVVSFGYFSLDKQRKVTRASARNALLQKN
jgi:hypothetical protein